MPSEKFWSEGRVEGDEPDLIVSWGDHPPQVLINGQDHTGGIDRLIRALERARNRVEAVRDAPKIAVQYGTPPPSEATRAMWAATRQLGRLAR